MKIYFVIKINKLNMEAQNAILTKIKNETEQQLQSQILPLLSQLVNNKIKEESDKFFEKTNILGDIFPKPKGSGLFRTCGKCCVCKENSKGLTDSFSKAANSVRFSTDQFKPDEYILLCSGYGKHIQRYPVEMRSDTWTKSNECRADYITNYGSIVNLYFYHRNGPNITIHKKGNNILTQEFITHYNEFINYSASGLRNDNYGSKELNHIDLANIIGTYNEYNPKSSEIYRIEKQKEEIKKMTLDLQKRETELVKNEKKLYEKQQEFEEEKKQFEEEKKIHKQKSKNLLKRENSVFLKESIKSIHQELSDISYSISDVIDLLEDVDPLIEQRLTQTIQKLTLIFNNDNDNDNVIHATPL